MDGMNINMRKLKLNILALGIVLYAIIMFWISPRNYKLHFLVLKYTILVWYYNKKQIFKDTKIKLIKIGY